MTTALATLLICVFVAALIFAVATYLWVNRTPTTDERFDKYGRVPLFGVEVGTGPPSGALIEQPGALGKLEEIDSAVNTDAAAPDVQSTVAGPADPRAPRIETVPQKPEAPRPGGTGWGENPGWPVGPRLVRNTPPPMHRVAQPTPPYSGVQRPQFASNAEPAASNGNGVYGSGVPGSMIEGHALRFSVPAEGTLQFLPGRLEISSGLDAGREIRFVRVPGPNGTEVTFGRNEGPLYRHIQLRDQTVSREHARMTLLDGAWHLSNLSRTNPVAYNGRTLDFGERQPLSDGDRVEMGEVVFNFRSR